MTIRTASLVFALSLLSTMDARGDDEIITVKNGEPFKLKELYGVTNCVRTAKMPPRVEIIAGPPGFSVETKPAKVVPVNVQNCKIPVDGAIVYLTAKDVKEPTSEIVVRWYYEHTYGGSTTRGRKYKVIIAP